jgi:hypothetical protein
MADEVINADVSLNELRAIVDADRAERAGIEPAVKETPAPADAKAEAEKPAPAPEPESTTQETPAERGADGKFKGKEGKEPADAPGVAKRIGKALEAQRNAERERDELKAQLAKPGSQPAADKAKETAQPAAPASPKQEDFATYDEFSRALARFEARQEIDKELATQREAGAKRERDTAAAKQQSDFGAAEVTAREKHADYDDVTAAIEWPKAPGTPAIADYLLSTQNADLMYELGNQPAELKRIAALSPMLAIAALAKFEAKLATPAEVVTPPARALPKPPRNIGGGGTPAAIDLETADMSVFKREFSKRLAADRN